MVNHDKSKKRILVVEDEPAITMIFQRVLKGMGFAVELAVDGVIAQAILEQKDFELIILDIRTPRMNGKELYGWLKEKYPDKADKVVFATGDTMNGNIQSFLEESKRPIILKPFTPGELRIVIDKVMRRNAA